MDVPAGEDATRSGSSPGPGALGQLESVVRTVAAASAAGALLGVLVGGVGGRLGMALLAAKNPDATGRISDDGFRIGQFTLGGTIQLLAACLQLGLIAAMIYLALRGLALGPRWLRVAELALGATVVFGAILISPDGVDFVILDPPLLPVAVFLVIPAVFSVLLCLLTEHWLAPTAWFARAPVRQVGATLLVWVLTGPLLVVLAAALGLGVVWRRASASVPARLRSGLTWCTRLLAGGVGIWALTALVADVDAILG